MRLTRHMFFQDSFPGRALCVLGDFPGRALCVLGDFPGRAAILLLLAVLLAPSLRAEYVVLQSGQRIKVTGYQLLGEKYRLQIAGGVVEVSAQDVVRIEPEDVFTPVPAQPAAQPPFRELVEAAAARYKVDADLISSVIAVESKKRQRADAALAGNRGAPGSQEHL
jgi:soluble lytic murein transglycosylase-like protein